MKTIKNLAWALASICSMGACSTTTVESLIPEAEEGNTVTVTASVPVTVTRAAYAKGGDLRYTAILHKENTTDKTIGDFVAIKEQVKENTAFAFEVEEPGDYVILFFADYVTTKTTSSNVKYYFQGLSSVSYESFTQSSNYAITGSTGTPCAKMATAIDATSYEYECWKAEIFNSDAYDAFAGAAHFKKTSKKEVLDPCTLTRIVSEITVKDKEEKTTSISNIDIANLHIYDIYNLYTGEASKSEAAGLPIASAIAQKDADLFFSYYTFASTGSSTDFDGCKGTINLKNKNKMTFNIPAGIFKLTQNNKYTVQGCFMNPNSKEVNITVGIDEDWVTNDPKDLE